MRHDEEMINKLRPKLQNNLRSLDMGSKQLEKDQLSLEKTFSKLTTKIDPPPELHEIHHAYNKIEPSAPLQDETSSLPSYDKVQKLYPSLETTSFVITDGIGQEEVTPTHTFVLETDEEGEEVEEKSTRYRRLHTGPSQHTRSKTNEAAERFKQAIHTAQKQAKNLSNFLNVLRVLGSMLTVPSSSSYQPTPPPDRPRPFLFMMIPLITLTHPHQHRTNPQ